MNTRGDVLSLREEISIGESGHGYQLQRPIKIAADDKGNIYVLDSKAVEIDVFDRTGEFVRKVGRSGYGPGEIDGANDVFVTNNEIGVNCGLRRNIIYFSLNGKYLRTVKSKIMFSQAVADSEGDLYGVMFSGAENMGPVLQLVRFSPSSGRYSVLANKRWKEPAPFTATMTLALLGDDKIAVGNPDRGYIVQIVNKAGSVIREIKKESKLIRIREEEMKKIEKYGPSPYALPKYYEPYYRVFAAEHGILLVEVHEGKNDKENLILDVFGDDGKYFGKIGLNRPIDFFWKNERFYTIQDDAQGLPSIKVFSVKWNLN